MRQPQENKARVTKLGAGAGWCEEFQEFGDWLDAAGLSVEGLPEWPGGAPVRVLATRGTFYLERVSRREYRQFQRMVARGEMALRAVPVDRVGEMHAVRITTVDKDKLIAWHINNERCN